MTHEQFLSLSTFNLEQFYGGAKVLFWDGNKAIRPDTQEYYAGHPLPLVLWLSREAEPMMFRQMDIDRQIRMPPVFMHNLEVLIGEEGNPDLAIYRVVDSKRLFIAEFCDQDKAQEYVNFLNTKEIK